MKGAEKSVIDNVNTNHCGIEISSFPKSLQLNIFYFREWETPSKMGWYKFPDYLLIF